MVSNHHHASELVKGEDRGGILESLRMEKGLLQADLNTFRTALAKATDNKEQLGVDGDYARRPDTVEAVLHFSSGLDHQELRESEGGFRTRSKDETF